VRSAKDANASPQGGRSYLRPIPQTPDPPLEAHGASYAVATPQFEATEVAVSIFREGGNAVDAAIAAAAALAVAYPHMCSSGGDVIGLIAAPYGDVRAINGSGAAPRAITPIAEGWSRMPLDGPHTVTVPGAVAAWQKMHGIGASMSWQTLLEPAVRLAADGVAVTASLARAIVDNSSRIAADPGLRDVLMPDGFPLPEGAALRQPALARSLGRIADGGAAALYGGGVGEELVSCLQELGSTIDLGDLRGHRTEVCEPLALPTGECEVLTAPPNSQGLVLLETLVALRELGPGDHVGAEAGPLAELLRLAAADRDRHLGDPRFNPVPVKELLSREHAAELAASARERRAGAAREGFSGSSAGDTIALATADAAGHAAVVVQSLFAAFGAGILDPASGIICHNRGAFFSLDPASPNAPRGRPRGRAPGNDGRPGPAADPRPGAPAHAGGHGSRPRGGRPALDRRRAGRGRRARRLRGGRLGPGGRRFAASRRLRGARSPAAVRGSRSRAGDQALGRNVLGGRRPARRRLGGCGLAADVPLSRRLGGGAALVVPDPVEQDAQAPLPDRLLTAPPRELLRPGRVALGLAGSRLVFGQQDQRPVPGAVGPLLRGEQIRLQRLQSSGELVVVVTGALEPHFGRSEVGLDGLTARSVWRELARRLEFAGRLANLLLRRRGLGRLRCGRLDRLRCGGLVGLRSGRFHRPRALIAQR
jgi:gamma-glutamyltranspeptidase